jgi:hypothetical protein
MDLFWLNGLEMWNGFQWRGVLVHLLFIGVFLAYRAGIIVGGASLCPIHALLETAIARARRLSTPVGAGGKESHEFVHSRVGLVQV